MQSKPVDIYGEHAGSTTEAQITGLNVNQQGAVGNHYIIPNGYKLKIYEVEALGDGETRVFLKTGTDSTYAAATTITRKKYKLASAGHLHISYKGMPFVIEAHNGDLYLMLGLIQDAVNPMSIQLHGEIKRIED